MCVSLAGLYGLHEGLYDLATVMLRIDLFAFGGGFASLPLMLHEVVQVRGWLDDRTFMDGGIALGQVTPGPTVITATFVGYLWQGLPGAMVATVAIFTPSEKSGYSLCGFGRRRYGLFCFVILRMVHTEPAERKNGTDDR